MPLAVTLNETGVANPTDCEVGAVTEGATTAGGGTLTVRVAAVLVTVLAALVTATV